MRDRTFSEEDGMLIVSFRQVFSSACDACKVHKGVPRWLLKQYPTVSAEVAVKARVMLSSCTDFDHEDTLKVYSSFVQFFLKVNITDDKKAKRHAEVCNLRKGSMAPAEFSQKLWRTILSHGSVYDENSLKALCVEGMTHLIFMTLQLWWAQHRYGSLEHLALRAKSVLNAQRRLQ